MKTTYLKKLLMLAIPIILSNVISQLQMLIDRIFLGQANILYMSALGNATNPLWTTISFCFALSMGASILISQNVGASNKNQAEEYAASLLKWSNLIPVLLFLFWFFFGEWIYRLMKVSDTVMPYCLGYTKYFIPVFLIVGLEGSCTVLLQTSGYTKPLIFYGLLRAGLNVLLDYVLIFGHWGFPALGIEGAAIATTIAEYTGCLYGMLVLMKDKKVITRPSLKKTMQAGFSSYIHSVKLGSMAALEDFTWNLGNLVLIAILNSINELAAGIYSIVFSVQVIIVVVITAIGNGTLTLSGEAKGRGDRQQFMGVIKIAYLISVLVSCLILIICLCIPEQILSLFTKDQEIITSCGLYLILVCVNLYAKSANIIVGNGIRGSGDTRWMFLTQIFGTIFIICCACLFVYGLHLGIAGVLLAVIVDEIVRAFINLHHLLKIGKKFT